MNIRDEDSKDAQAGWPGELKLDVEKYRHYVDGFDISEKQKIELLHSLWNMMTTFVRLGWGIDSAQQVSPAIKAHWEADQKQHSPHPDSNQSVASDGTAGASK